LEGTLLYFIHWHPLDCLMAGIPKSLIIDCKDTIDTELLQATCASGNNENVFIHSIDHRLSRQ